MTDRPPRRRRRPPQESNMDPTTSTAPTSGTEETPTPEEDLDVDTGHADYPEHDTAAVPARDDLAIEMRQPPTTETFPEGEVLDEEDEDDAEAEAALRAMIHQQISAVVSPLHHQVQALHEQITQLRVEVDEATRAADAASGFADDVEELQQMLNDTNDRLDRVEEACGLKPTLLSAAQAAVSRLDAMAQDGKLQASEIRSIHRTLRRAVHDEQARRQS